MRNFVFFVPFVAIPFLSFALFARSLSLFSLHPSTFSLSPSESSVVFLLLPFVPSLSRRRPSAKADVPSRLGEIPLCASLRSLRDSLSTIMQQK